MPGRNAASARPDRTAKNAAIAVAKTAPATCESDECCTTRTSASTTATASAAPAAILTSCCHVQNTTNTTVGRAVSIEPRHPPSAADSRCRISASTVSGVATVSAAAGSSVTPWARSRRTG